MTPSARVQAAIEILDDILAGAPAEKALTGWARRSRFAGSKDRAAIRDHVFDALRCKRSFAALGGAETGRGLMLGSFRAEGRDPGSVFTGERHAPDPVREGETGHAPRSEPERLDIPDWLWPSFSSSLGSESEPVAKALQCRAPIHLRVNLRKATVPDAIAALARDGIEVARHLACDTALEVTSGARGISQNSAYLDGMVELQDAASQAVVAALNLAPGMRVLDYCAGGGGKTLALAANEGVEVFSHDAAPGRMQDLPVRANRAGVKVTTIETTGIARLAPFDLVLVDAPCSGSGSWRRSPAGKWALTAERLQELTHIQGDILAQAASVVSASGVLAYATCSVLDEENGLVVETFLQDHPDWVEIHRQSWLVSQGTDGFFTSHLTRNRAR
ncbi:RsmB/NOP family class I SAM-dependent RNA methyltransferase [Ruegeria sediminis]|uniref:RsmB/NOP family class I SAM-dependent RNA methyltransferase n=1 Tax=Ruegeria sediminis TaxID=2583820 RepID=A0ABY2WZX0_9RHOB|nr:RsmB/NOP family class I SAM-dependent RNA methyltransferase [Ruegeria sediminis]TMV08512.1 RsmB/NOP family class I SAM-dependent RNA methyltransferase [Ruegeria sediminis]